MDLTASQKPAGNEAKNEDKTMDALPLCDSLSVAQIVTEILLLSFSGLTHSVGINCDFWAKE